MSGIDVSKIEDKELAAKITELVGKAGEVDELRTQLEGRTTENKTLITARDAAKEAKRIEEEKRLAESGEFKTLYETQTGELESLRTRSTELEGTINGYREREEAEFKTLLESVPEALRESISDESIPLSKRLELAKNLSKDAKPSGPNVPKPGETKTNTITRAEFDALRPLEKSKFLKDGGKLVD